MVKTREDIIEEVIENVKFDIDRLDDETFMKKPQDSIGLETFWLQFDYAVQKVSNEVTKLSLQFSKPPYPEVKETCTILNELKSCYTQLLAVYYHVSKDVGAGLHKELKIAVKKIMYSLFEVIKSLKNLSAKGNQDRLVYTGKLWDSCSAVEKLPRDNHQAALMYIERQKGLVYDALKEIEEEICSDTERLNTPGDSTPTNEEVWNNQEREMAGSCTGLLKTACACMKRIHEAVKASGKCDTVDHIQELDKLCEHISKLSPAVDEFGSEIYPPMSMDSVRLEGAALVKILRDILEYVKTTHLVEEDSSWVDFLLRAVDHNNNKLQPFHCSTEPVLLFSNLNLKT